MLRGSSSTRPARLAGASTRRHEVCKGVGNETASEEMPMTPSRREVLLTGLGGIAGAATGALGLRSARAADPFGVGFVYVGPISNAGWTYQHNLGRLAVEKAFGSRVKTNYVESVPEGADAERVIRQLSASNGLIFTTSFGYMEPTLKVARQFPNIRYEHCTG